MSAISMVNPAIRSERESVCMRHGAARTLSARTILPDKIS